jgi:crotonobetainyl-CoA:carnitine CoA-transferase CaiB-like acyl-CoA transferase
VEGLEALGADSRFDDLAGRLAHQDELDEMLGAWTAQRTEWEVAFELQQVGVPAAPMMDNYDVIADPQLAARDFFRVVSSERFGADVTYGQAIVLSDTPARFDAAPPSFGQHTREVLGDVAGLDEREIDDLIEAGVAQETARPELHFERPFLHWIPRVMRLPWPAATVDPAAIIFERLSRDLLDADE